jgi:hypothetical protein
MWQPLFGADEPDEVPDRPRHQRRPPPTWLGREMQDLLRRHLGPSGRGRCTTANARSGSRVPGEELWQAHQAQKRRLGRFTPEPLRDQLARHGRSPEELREVESFFRPRRSPSASRAASPPTSAPASSSPTRTSCGG